VNRVKELRLKSGMQQKEIAVAVSVSRPTISEWEHQKKDPSGDRLRRLSDLFGVPAGYILGIDNMEDGEVIAPRGLSDDEQILLDRYRALSDDDKELLRSDALRMKREADRGTGSSAQRTAG